MLRMFIALTAVFVLALPFTGNCEEDEKILARAVDLAAAGDRDAAFMSLHALVSVCPGSPRVPAALFSMGEYYFATGNLRDAAHAFFTILKQYPGEESIVFCYAYLLEISRKQKKDSQVKALTRALANARRLVFVFADSKEVAYTSVLGTAYKAVYYMDKVDIYAHGEVFTSVSY